MEAQKHPPPPEASGGGISDGNEKEKVSGV
jgi:hypothetical protein